MVAHTSDSELVPTSLGRLNIRRSGSGPPALLWHSLWVDSRSWGPLVDAFGACRQVITVDGPGYGDSDPIHRDFTLDDCADAAVAVLDHLDVSGPLDWVGNAWGGHVGITLAAVRPERVRSLVTINTPPLPVGRRQRWTTGYPLALLYRFAGPRPVITKALFDALLGSAPTLFLTGDVDGQQWSPAHAQAAAATMPDARVITLSGAGHIGPLLVDTDLIASAVAEFWRLSG